MRTVNLGPNDTFIVPISVSALRKLGCPVTLPPWDTSSPITPKMVLECIATDDTSEDPIEETDSLDPIDHARRIAHLMTHGWEAPIEIELPMASQQGSPDWPVQRGNHHLYAAIMKNDKEITTMISGSIDLAEELFDLEVTITK